MAHPLSQEHVDNIDELKKQLGEAKERAREAGLALDTTCTKSLAAANESEQDQAGSEIQAAKDLKDRADEEVVRLEKAIGAAEAAHDKAVEALLNE